ncbi:MAG: outer membrane lipid asymmetry maintenance protein MlaD [Alphaproteobacteria bacterium]|nr:outer membrane lipid asymmetry maintenance protein MlaD [Alphaproteobacteria bacterium]MBV9153915.1 outer membrane lipid asymmetry maintenance protein MlaD [Alphaproteobacteria bacterium]MBV9587030.1 outer membrane lipid asymmetry maintenance protein MlaD [Alphaproteobacteria bacterium]MBV9966346.1 outer membrane lipid asymmetry maintenance protein MlaD [Alphaproteobacteria bacterium]
MRGNLLETVMGAVVLLVAALFLFFAYNTSQLRAVPGYELSANFERIDGVREGGDVRISGIKIGSIVSQTLDPKTFLARLTMSIDPSYKLPDDTVAEIVSAGLLGDKYLSLVPGGSETMIPPGGEIKYTQSSVTLENLIGQMIFSKPGANKQGEGKQGEGEAPADQQGQPQAKPGAAPAPAKQ